MKDGTIQAYVVNDHLLLPAPNENGRGGLKAVALSLKAPSFLSAIIRLQMGNVAYREFSTNEFERRTRELLFLKLSTVLFISSSSSCCRLLPASFFLSVFLHLALALAWSTGDFTKFARFHQLSKHKLRKENKGRQILSEMQSHKPRSSLPELRKSSVKPCETKNVFLF